VRKTDEPLQILRVDLMHL